jgi:hypothetical protein
MMVVYMTAFLYALKATIAADLQPAITVSLE